MPALLWISIAFVLYAYAGYPACLWILRLFRRRIVDMADTTPRVTYVITVHNEARRLIPKLENTLLQDYPRDRFELIVASDCSTDETDTIARSYAGKGVRLIRAEERKGKENAQRLAVAAASGDVLVFSDVATTLDPDGVRRIVRAFNDPSVGCVSSVDRMIDDQGRLAGEGGYVRYEMFLRTLETEVNSLVGLSGSFFAARREICTPWPVNVPSDFTTVLNAVSRGLRGVSDPGAIGYYRDLADPKREYARKVRTVVRGISALLTHRRLLNPFRYGLFAWQLASHKLCRWMVPFAMLAAAVANLSLAGRGALLYDLMAGGQIVMYALAALSMRWAHPLLRLWRPFGFLIMANVSILDAWYRVMLGRTVVAWTPSER